MSNGGLVVKAGGQDDRHSEASLEIRDFLLDLPTFFWRVHEAVLNRVRCRLHVSDVKPRNIQARAEQRHRLQITAISPVNHHLNHNLQIMSATYGYRSEGRLK